MICSFADLNQDESTVYIDPEELNIPHKGIISSVDDVYLTVLDQQCGRKGRAAITAIKGKATKVRW